MNTSASFFEKIAISISNWSEKWFPDAYVFALIGVVVVAVAAWSIGAPITSIATSFGDGYWSLIPFTLQMSMLIIIGYVVSISKPIEKFISTLARFPKSGHTAFVFIAFITSAVSFVHWGLGTIFGALLVIALAKRKELNMDYRAAAAAALIGGSTWALGFSSSAALLHANKSSLPENIYNLSGIIPFSETIFLWQSIVMAILIVALACAVAYFSAPKGNNIKTIDDFKISFDTETKSEPESEEVQSKSRPGDWLEISPLLSFLVAGIGIVWLIFQFTTQGPINTISNLNSYNFIFLLLAIILHKSPRNFLNAVNKAVPACAGILIQFPLYGSIAYMMTKAINIDGLSLSHYLSDFFVSFTSKDTFPLIMGAYSAILGFIIPSGGGKWIIEAPYVLHAANDLKVHLGWSIQIYNAAEALPNLINPFFMLPLLGILKIKAKDVIGFTVTQLIFHAPIVLFLLWILAKTLTYVPPMLS